MDEAVRMGKARYIGIANAYAYQVAKIDVHLTADDIHYLEEPYMPHKLSGVMAVNKPVMNEKPVWETASNNK